MSDPIRIRCEEIRGIPGADDLLRIVDAEHHVVLEFPREQWQALDKGAIISALSSSLSEYSIFDSGGDRQAEWITVKKVVARATVLERLSLIKKALVAYSNACATLISQRDSGQLSAEWEDEEHGGDVCFKNINTGQTIEAPLSGAPQLERIDPYFWAVFVKSTGAYPEIAALLNDDFHDASKILEVVIEVTGPTNRSSGLSQRCALDSAAELNH